MPVQTVVIGGIRLRVNEDPDNPGIYVLTNQQIDAAGDVVEGSGGAGGSADFGTAIDGQTLATGEGNLGWLSSVYKALTDRLPTIGQKAKAASLSVTLSNDHDAVSVTGTVAVTGGSTSANQATELARIGIETETAPANDTASSGLNGRLQRIAQRASSLIALFPASLGQKTMAASLAVALASDQTSIPVAATLVAGTNTNEVVGDAAEDAALAGNPLRMGGRASTAIPTAMSADNDIETQWLDRNGAAMMRKRPVSTATLANVTAATSSVTLLAANTARAGAKIFNDSTSALRLKYGSTASATSFVELVPPGGMWIWDDDGYTGIITGIWDAANGAARTLELTS